MDPLQALRDGASHHKAGRLREAQAAYRAVLQADPHHPDALYLMGMLACHVGQRESAQHYLARAAAARPDLAAWQHTLAQAWLAIDDHDRAIAAARSAVSIEPADASYPATLAIALFRAGGLDEAIEQFERAFALGLDQPDACAWCAMARNSRGDGHRGDFEAAERAARRAIALRPDDERAHHALGLALAQQGRFPPAVQSLESALRLRPPYAEAHHALAVIHCHLDDLERAAQHYQAAISLKPRLLEARFEYAALLEKQNDIPAAIQEYQAILKARPEMEDVRFHLAALEQGRDAPAQAPRSYVSGFFDRYASTFDQHLMQNLDYRGPQLLREAIGAALGSPPPGSLDILDLGCGTGLLGEALQPLSRRLVGVDLSAGMLQRARARGIYSELIQDDLSAALGALTNGGRAPPAFDLVVSADVLSYLGDLDPLFGLIASALRSGGILALLTESAETDDQPWNGPGFRLLANRRYAHALPSLRRACEAHALAISTAHRTWARKELDQPVSFWLIVAQKSPGSTVDGMIQPVRPP